MRRASRAVSHKNLLLRRLAVLLAVFFCLPYDEMAAARDISATPADYRKRITELRPGDRLLLASGEYRYGLRLEGLRGETDNPIIISGPYDHSAVFLGRPNANTVELREVSYLEIRNLTLNGLNIPGVDGVKSQAPTHHVTLDSLKFINHGANQQQVAISTKAPAWNWTIRNCIIQGAGTGIYLGDSDGSAPFMHGLIEGNVILNPIGYGIQLKHQTKRPPLPGVPADFAAATTIRNNAISKADRAAHGFHGARPNVLVGHFPKKGPGSADVYEIYGNLLYQNRDGEPLFQGEGNIAFYNNLLVNHSGDGVWIQPHHGRPREVSIFNNTIVVRGTGIAIRNADPQASQVVFGNAVFAARPIIGGEKWGNLASHYATAGSHLRAPFAAPPNLDLRPRPAHLERLILSPYDSMKLSDTESDFAGNPREAGYLGAYAGPDVPKDGLVGLFASIGNETR